MILPGRWAVRRTTTNSPARRCDRRFSAEAAGLTTVAEQHVVNPFFCYARFEEEGVPMTLEAK